MILTISTTHEPATDLGYLLHKNPKSAQTFDLAFGKAHVVYPEADDKRCSCALILDVDPIRLVRRPNGQEGSSSLAHYVNDRPYVASSYLSVAIAQVFGSALGARFKDRPDLVDKPLPLEATIDVLPCRGGIEFIKKLFEPLGYIVDCERIILDPMFPEWGESFYYKVKLIGTVTLADLLCHLYVLIPTVDSEKHYAIGDEEVEKLVRRGDRWLPSHPEKELIVRHYLKQRRSLVREALDQLTDDQDGIDEPVVELVDAETEVPERKVSLHTQRIAAELDVIRASGAKRVVDLGCGEGRLIEKLLKERQFTEILGMDVSYRSLEKLQERLRFERLPSLQRDRVKIIHGSLIYRDKRLEGYDAAAIVEVIEHLDEPRIV